MKEVTLYFLKEGKIIMRELKYCYHSIIYKHKWSTYFIYIWIAALIVVFFQFFGNNTTDKIGTIDTSYFIVSSNSLLTEIALFSIPFISAIFIGDIHFEEREFDQLLFIRGKKIKFAIAHIIISFVSSFLLCLCFLFIILILTYFITSHDIDMINYSNYLYNNSNQFSLLQALPYCDLYINHPILRIYIYITLFSVYAGISGMIADTMCLFFNKKILVYISPFIILMLNQLLCTIFSSRWYLQSLIIPFTPPYGITNVTYCVFIITIFYIVICALLYVVHHRLEVKS